MNKLILSFVILIGSTTLLWSQPPPPPDPAAVPIDGGLGILLAAGAALGAKKAWDARKKPEP